MSDKLSMNSTAGGACTTPNNAAAHSIDAHRVTSNAELLAMRRWISSLSLDEFVDALRFSFETDDGKDIVRDASRVGPSGNGVESHELELFLQMVKLQSPSATPIHPRAVSYRPASRMGVTDGRDEESRIRKDRFVRPRLFQLIERSVPPSTHRDNFKGRGKINASRRKHDKKNLVRKRRFDVIARKFVTSCGEVLSVGSTLEQRLADECMIRGTRITGVGSEGDCRVSTPPQCSLCVTEIGCDGNRRSKKNSAKNRLLSVLRLASRGRFLSTCCGSSSVSAVPFGCPWLDPKEWFSLPMFLASRYELSLWKTFANQDAKAPSISQTLSCKYSASMIKESLVTAVGKAVLNHLHDCLENVGAMRDCTVYGLLLEPQGRDCIRNVGLFRNGIEKSSIVEVLDSITGIPLVDIGTARDDFRIRVNHHFNQCLAKAAEMDLLQSLTPSLLDITAQNKKNKKKKKKRKKKLGQDITKHNKSPPPRVVTEVHTHECVQQLPPKTEVCTDRNENLMIVLSLIDEMIDGVFSGLGLTDNDLPWKPCDKGPKDKINIQIQQKKQERLLLNPKTKKQPGKNTPKIVANTRNSTKTTRNTVRCDSNRYGPAMRGENVLPNSNRAAQGQEMNYKSAVCSQMMGTKHATAPPSAAPPPILQGNEEKPCGTTIADDKLHKNPTVIANVDRVGMPPQNDPGSSTMNHQFVHDPQSDPYERGPPSEIAPIFSFSDSMQRSLHGLYDHSRYAGSSNLYDMIGSFGMGGSGAFDTWGGGTKHLRREESLFCDFFANKLSRPEEILMASSTAASIAEDSLIGEVDIITTDGIISHDRFHNEIVGLDTSVDGGVQGYEFEDDENDDNDEGGVVIIANESLKAALAFPSMISDSHPTSSVSIITPNDNHEISPPHTPPPQMSGTPQLSPILVSLADLGEIRKMAKSKVLQAKLHRNSETLFPSKKTNCNSGTIFAGSLPSSPKVTHSLTPSWSRDDLRINSSVKDGHRGRSNHDMYKFNKLERPASSVSCTGRNDLRHSYQHHPPPPPPPPPPHQRKHPIIARSDSFHGGSRASSASPDDGRTHDEARHRRNSHSNHDDRRNHAPDAEDSLSREERNGYRDMCLTLGAEVIKLKNMLAAEIGSSLNPVAAPTGCGPIRPFHAGYPGSVRAPGPASDAGAQRFDHESARSEDGADVAIASDAAPWGTERRRRASGTCCSDASTDRAHPRPHHRDPPGAAPPRGLQSRLSVDIRAYLAAVSSSLRKMDGKRNAAVKRISRVVTALWPRAQVNLYGSHVTNLCHPKSDLDFVICLPAVHKNAPADAPGVLEGRNAINETWQKVLARKLKGESWLDPRSIKIIERTIVPVLKVRTKDRRDQVLQLDISFGGPDHHGLEALSMVKEIMEEFPMVRPLTLVLKQFLDDRSLLASFTGGLSSHCLFLMITRYLQEQSPLWGDCGSLLMGFLDFYGNHFDPRATGISVRRRQYFSRQRYDQAALSQHDQGQVWGVAAPQQPQKNHFRGTGSGHHGTHVPSQHYVHSGRPYAFDPLFVEDPLSSGNNVGRNAFRVFQVKRAFADAHRALVGSLEWDMNAADCYSSDYPLLKCLLKSEDVFYELDI